MVMGASSLDTHDNSPGSVLAISSMQADAVHESFVITVTLALCCLYIQEYLLDVV